MTTRSSTSTRISNGSGTAITGVTPSGSVAGDRLLAWIVQDTSATHTGPGGEGWSKLSDVNTIGAPADGQTCTIWEKKASSGSETYAFTSTASQRAIIQVVALSGRHTTTAATVSTPTINLTDVNTPISVAVTGLTAAAGDDVVWFGQLDQVGAADAWSFGAISGFTNLQNDCNGNYVTAACFSQDNAAGGSTGTLTSSATRSTGSSNASWSGVVVAIPSSGGGGGPTSYYLSDTVEM